VLAQPAVNASPSATTTVNKTPAASSADVQNIQKSVGSLPFISVFDYSTIRKWLKMVIGQKANNPILPIRISRETINLIKKI
jgi:hypothetical protein